MQSCNHASMQNHFLPPHYPIYCTGDLAKWLHNGNIEFIGRKDQQAKIRGFRIECREIENQLLTHKKIKEAVVLIKTNENGDKYLCAYIVSKENLPGTQIKKYLSTQLPGYMIPSYIIQIEKIPLTTNGKIDHKALPGPEMITGTEYVAPGNAVEKALVQLWSEVLLIEKATIGIHDDFFELGGHSLKATVLAARIHKALDIKLPLAEIFRTPTIRKLSQYIKEARQDKYASIEPVEKREYYALSSAQKRMYILQQMELDNTAYNMPEVIPLTSQPDLEKLEKTFIQLIQRHESLRTSFHKVKDIPVQKVHNKVESDFDLHDVHDCHYHDFLKSFVRPFDLAKAPLLRVGLIVLPHTPTALRGHPRRGTYNSQEGRGQEYLLMVDMHHIISDGMSHEVLVKDFMVLNEDKELPLPLRIQYKDFSQWQNSEKEKENIKQQELYWLREFEGEIPVLNIPTDYNRPVIQSFEGNTVSFEISANEAGVLKAIALKKKMTLYMVLLTIFNVLLAKLSNQEDIVIGTPIAGRRHTDLDNIIGMFVNTLAMRNYPKGEKNFNDFLIEVKQRTLEAFENQEYQFEDLVEKVEVKRDLSRNPLFDIMFAKQNINVDEPKTLEPDGTHGQKQDSKQEPPRDRYTSSKFDMTLTVLESKQKPAFTVTYNTALFKKETIEIFIGYFKRIISSITFNIETKLSQIEIMSIEEKRQLVYDFNDTRADSPGDKTIHRLFEEQVEKTADHIGVVDLSHHLTYRELNNKSHRLARLVKRKAVGPGNIAAIITHPVQEMLVGIMGVLKAGACYLPIDPANPPARISYMLMDSETKLVLIQEGLADDIKDYAGEILKIRDSSLYKGESPADVQNNNPADPLYMIYTSGTTGTPKGVMVKHENLVNYVTWFSDTAGLTGKDKTVLTSSFAFDLGYTSLYPSILKGGQIHLLPKETYMIPETLLGYIQLHRITYLKMTPSLFSPIVESPYFSAEICRCLRLLVLGGEPINVSAVEKALCTCTHLRVMNHYGPTEVTIGCIAQLINIHNWEAFRARPTIGKPIRNINVFILDKYLNLLPIRIAGELYLGGAGVAKGYFKRESLTAAKFIPLETAAWSAPLPPTSVPGNGIIYSTGDRARWLPDGNIEFLGRIDQQVKIRGFRIELGEIEGRLLSHPGIKEALVVAKKEAASDQQYLASYIVGVKEFDAAELRRYLELELPDYMIPSYFVLIETFPLTPNGKIDVKALPEPGPVPAQSDIAPRNEIEKKLAGIWAEVLGRNQRIGIDDHFFQLGGHSLKATIMVSRIHKELNIHVPLAEIFKSSTIRKLAEYISGSAEEKYESIRPVEVKEYYELSSAQKRLYFLQQMELDSIAYNMPEIIPLPGQPDREKLEKTFIQLIQRHQSLRTSFHMVKDIPVQKVHDTVEFGLDLHDVHDYRDFLKSFVRPFDLAKAPLVRVGLLAPPHTPAALPGHPRRGAYNSQEGKEDRFLLMVDMHHIISDGMSHGVLVKDFMVLNEDKELPPPLRIQYKDFSQWQNSREEKEKIKQQEAYWLKVFAGEIPVLNIPMDYPRPAIQSFEGSAVHFEMGSPETQLLKTNVREEGVTPYMMLLAIFTILLSKLAGQEDIVIGTPVAGRRHADLEKIIGMFVNTLALRNYPIGAKTFSGFLKELKERTLQAFENQEYQFEDLVEKAAVNRDLARNPLFDVMFILQNIDRFPGDGVEDVTVGNETIEKALPYSQEYDNIFSTSKFDLTITAVELEPGLQISFQYCTKLFKKETVRRFILYFNNIVSKVVKEPGIKISEIEIISEEERKRILYDFNDTQAEYPQDKTIHRLFEEQVERTPDHVALIGEISNSKSQIPNKEDACGEGTRGLAPLSVQATYKELNNKSNRLAYLLKEKGGKPDTIVGIMVERSVEMIIGIMGILKAGGAYLPIAPDYPRERIKYMLEDSSAGILLTTRDLSEEITFGKEILHLPDAINRVPTPHLHLPPAPVTSLAYVIYTSGSTGVPKGTLVEHKGVMNILCQCERLYPLGNNGAYLLKTNYMFDVSIIELFAWINGKGRVVILEPGRERIPGAIVNEVLRSGVTHINFVPSMLNMFLQGIDETARNHLKYLKYIFVAGEVFPADLANKAVNLGAAIQVENIYGPTEATVYSTAYSCTRKRTMDRVPIGKPLSNLQIYILDKTLHLQPIGVLGELCIGGIGLARGYLNNPELTAGKFMREVTGAGDRCKWKYKASNKKLFRGVQGGGFLEKSPPGRRRRKVYKTGDLARWLPDGNIQFSGRIDHQVKIRGFRIELGEIENRLLRHADIKEALVVARKEASSDQQYLASYIVGVKEFDVPELRRYLEQELPTYMIPSYFVRLETFPLTASGKIDVKALPEPGAVFIPGENYAVPRNEIEKKLIEICSEVLGRNPSSGTIGIDDDFFRIGGNSLSLMQFTSKVNNVFKVEIPLVELFKNAKIREISKWILRNDLIKSKTEPLFIFNDNKPGKIFCFPHWIAHGIAFRGIATYFENTTFYSFNFIEAEERLREYSQLIIKFQEKGPYVLLGYSAGGILVFEVAKELERQGYEVGDLIFLDVDADKKKHDAERIDDIGRAGEDFNNHVLKTVEEMGLDSLKQDVLNKLRNYSNYFSNMAYMGIINANIHHIIAGNRVEDESANLGRFTTGNFKIYRGFGNHLEMLDPGNIDKNAKIIREIMQHSSYII